MVAIVILLEFLSKKYLGEKVIPMANDEMRWFRWVSSDIPQNIFFYVPKKKSSQTGLEQDEGE